MLGALADAVLLLHLAVVLFVVGGLGFIVVGNLLGRRGANAPAFRWLHLGTIAVVVLQSWLGLECPLTTLENALRRRSGGAGYEAGFIEHWVGLVLYHQAPPWVFVLLYTVFGLAVLLAWLRWPPRRAGRQSQRRTWSQ